MLVPDLRPLSVGEIIDVAIKIWRRHLATLAKIVFVVVAPLQLLAGVVAASVSSTETGFETYDSEGNPTLDGGAFAGWLAGMFTAQALSALAFLIASAAVLRAVSVAYLGGTPDWRDSLRAATTRLRSLIWLGLLTFFGLALAAVALFVPFIWLSVSWSLAFPVLVGEGSRGTQAMRRSFRLVRGRWWPVCGAVALSFMFEFFVGLVIGLPLAFLTSEWDSGSVEWLAVNTVVNVGSSVVTTPFMAAVLVLIYFDLRVRKEGFDLELLSQGVGVPGAELPARGPWTAPGGYPGSWAPPGTGWSPPGNAPPGAGPHAPPPPGGGWPAPSGGWPSPAPGPGGPAATGPVQPAAPAPAPSFPPSGPGDGPDPTGAGQPPAGAPPAGWWGEPIDPTGGWGPPPTPPAPAGDDEPS